MRQSPLASFNKAQTLLELGDEQKSVTELQDLLKRTPVTEIRRRKALFKVLAIAYMRLGERTNCLHNHSAQSCLFPIMGAGVHLDKSGSLSAIKIYESLLKDDPSDLESRWLLNVAYMTVGEYPQNVPQEFLIDGLGADTLSHIVKPFSDVAMNIGLNTNNLAGGNIIDDFNNDDYLDIVTSSWSLDEGMHYCRNNGSGTFTDISDSSGLSAFTGGLQMIQTDYNNDGYKDILVLRGAWKGVFGREPNSLLRNNGNGTFTDVTKQSGMLSFHPTQTATWNDFNNDGWLDVFIGNESREADINPCELYMNNQDGTFTESANKSKTDVIGFVKGVTSGDYNNDGWPDIFLSLLDERKVLLKNEGVKNGVVQFKDVTKEAGLGDCHTRTFPTTFFDYDNDGWLDILACNYDFNGSLASYAAAEALGKPVGNAAKQFLFRNKHDGTFEDVTDKAGLNKVAFAMGMNFGDIDNDGYPDIYMGTGNPLYQSLVPNKLFKNMNGQYFVDATSSARVGNLQKGHGVAFADLDNDGDQDIYIEMGGAYKGDNYQNSLYLNPGQNNNNWIDLKFEGTKCNRAAIGARVKVTFKENGIERSVYRDVNSGASFGANPLIQHIGIGTAQVIDRIEIKWPVSNAVQVFKNIQPRQSIKIKEGKDSFTKFSLNKVDFSAIESGLVRCVPVK
ncbi:MAG: CRTAC1 family protein, partial [Bacteroidota bacterium]